MSPVPYFQVVDCEKDAAKKAKMKAIEKPTEVPRNPYKGLPI